MIKRTITSLCLLLCMSASFAKDMPGKGVTVNPIKGSPANAWFQHMVVQLGLEALGYEIEETREAEFVSLHLAIGSGDGDYTINHWKPLHNNFFEKSGGDDAMLRSNPVIRGAGQGYFMDKKTAEANGITNIGQLKDPAIRKLFDADDDGLANLSGCNPGWGCEVVIEKHMDKFGLRKSVEHDQGQYFAIMADTITRYKEGNPIFYYTWTPNWISDVLVPGVDVVQIGVPASDDSTTAQADGSDPGFAVNDVYAVVNKKFAQKNPAAAKFLDIVQIPISAVNAAQIKLRDGGDKLEDFRSQAQEWISANQTQFDAWVAEAAAAK